MAFGALLGASTYVCMNVIGMIILLKPSGPMRADPALIRDIAGYLLLLLLTLPIFITGLSWSWVLVLNGVYAALTGVTYAACRTVLSIPSSDSSSSIVHHALVAVSITDPIKHEPECNIPV